MEWKQEQWADGLSEEEKAKYEACAAYFKEHDILNRLLYEFKYKYRTYGRFGGNVELNLWKPEQTETLEGFLQKNLHGQENVTVSAAQFQKALENSRFAGVEPKRLLELYFQEEMIGNQESLRRNEKARQARWNQMMPDFLAKYEGTPAQAWLLEQEYRTWRFHLDEAEKTFELSAQILNQLPCRRGEQEYLAVFAAAVTGNPHAFDGDSQGGKLLTQLLEWDAAQRNIKIEKSELFRTLYRRQLYYAAGILRDDSSNCAMVCGVRAWKKDGGIDAGMEGFLKEAQPVQVPLGVIAKWSRIECPQKKIYIVENPSIYTILCQKWKGTTACMCMNGQPRLSALMMFDLLAEAGVVIYYAGDFDPEGLLIAQKLKQYYKGEFHYRYMTAKMYERCRSEQKISESRLDMLEQITDSELAETAAAIAEHKLAGYQENMWEVYVQA